MPPGCLRRSAHKKNKTAVPSVSHSIYMKRGGLATDYLSFADVFKNKLREKTAGEKGRIKNWKKYILPERSDGYGAVFKTDQIFNFSAYGIRAFAGLVDGRGK